MIVALLLTVIATPVFADERFEKEVRPVLAEHCYGCHSTKAKTKFAGLLLDSRAAAFKGGDTGPVIVPGKPLQSKLLMVLRGSVKPAMPPGGRLPEAKIAAIERWIADGAPWPDESATVAPAARGFDLEQRRREHWAWQPVRSYAAPEVRDGTWPKQPIDRFLLAALEGKGLKPAADADRRVLIRRLTYDLTGLPPTPAEIADFVNDASADAYGRLVDRLLGSPRYGEHWARHWMDLMRYSESHGSEGDPDVPKAWRYRDYLIRAFNRDVPYDQLVREHLAGDLLAKPRVDPLTKTNESMLGPAHFRMVEHGFQPVDPWEDRVKWTDNQIDVVSKTFQGLTVSCARCHDHKFDAISQKDYYALFGVVAGARPTQRSIDAPGSLEVNRAKLEGLKDELRARLADSWVRSTPAVPAQWTKLADSSSFRADWEAYVSQWRGELGRRAAFNSSNFRQAFELPKDFGGFVQHGVNVAPGRAGAFAIPSDGERAIQALYPRGVYTHLLSQKHPGVFSSPRFKIESDYLSFRLLGRNFAFAQLIIENYAVPRGGIYNLRYSPKSGDQMAWATWNTNFWKGFTAYVEFSTQDDVTHFQIDDDAQKKKLKPEHNGRSAIGVQSIVFHDGKEPPKEVPLEIAEILGENPASGAEFAAMLTRHFRAAVQAWREDRLSDQQVAFLNLYVDSLPQASEIAPLLSEYRRLEAEIPVARRAPGVVEDNSPDQPLLIRGNHKSPSAAVPRGYLTALGGHRFGSNGRLRIAGEIANPDNPLTARVMANRVWARFFGHGIVSTVDNFGKLGDTPTHPELLDYLAGRFVSEGWSVKKLVRLLVTSRAYQMSSQGSAEGRRIDPANKLLQHTPVRRLEAESIRDSILAVAGSIDAKQFGESVPVYYDHDQGKTKGDKPKGPLDGNGRRSIYLEVRRNATNPFLEVFDYPKPSTTRGERDLTNVPAQSLTLMNGMFVIDQATKWAERLIAAGAPPARRIDSMFESALGRPASAKERDAVMSYLGALEAEHNKNEVLMWRDIAQSLFNLKEFLYVR